MTLREGGTGYGLGEVLTLEQFRKSLVDNRKRNEK